MIGDLISTGTGGPEATECPGIACDSAAVVHNAVDRDADCRLADTLKPVAATAVAAAAGVEKVIGMRAHSRSAANMSVLRSLRHWSEQDCKYLRGCLSVKCMF